VHLEMLGTWGGVLLGLLCSDFVAYWLHRVQHRSPALWRFTHQLHHSAERVDVLGVGFFQPLDIAIGALFTSVVVAVLGLSANAVALAGLVTLFMGVLQHLNLRTPVWLGYLVQRPESHSLHHLRGFHAGNYGNLALWDIVFGTFQNPREFAGEAGFYDGASVRLREMLLGRDIQR
jgi:sterol desaturase/sphingolipid hydroxylase (fatty acid hydroxylase superfamily)